MHEYKWVSASVLCTDKKENTIFLIKGNSEWSSCKVMYEEGLRIIYEEMRKYFPIYEEAVSHIWLCNCSILNFLIYEEDFIFFFYQCDTQPPGCIWPGISNKIFIHARTGLYRSQSRIARVHCKKRFPVSPAGMSLTKLSLAGNYLIVPGRREFGKWTGWGQENS